MRSKKTKAPCNNRRSMIKTLSCSKTIRAEQRVNLWGLHWHEYNISERDEKHIIDQSFCRREWRPWLTLYPRPLSLIVKDYGYSKMYASTVVKANKIGFYILLDRRRGSVAIEAIEKIHQEVWFAKKKALYSRLFTLQLIFIFCSIFCQHIPVWWVNHVIFLTKWIFL